MEKAPASAEAFFGKEINLNLHSPTECYIRDVHIEPCAGTSWPIHVHKVTLTAVRLPSFPAEVPIRNRHILQDAVQFSMNGYRHTPSKAVAESSGVAPIPVAVDKQNVLMVAVITL